MSAIIILILRTLLTLCLYGFLGFVTWVQWRSLNESGISKHKNFLPFIALTNQADQKREEYNKTDIYIGRESTSDLVINQETISLQHARIFFKNNQWLLEDLNSTNGSYINDERVFTPVIIVSGDLIAFGNEIFEVEV
jgi:pSer/pThr/pTyr-binding forkhead associated (FHA) protein